MVRRTAITLTVAAAVLATAAWGKPKAKGDPSAKQPLALRLRAIDLVHRLILIEVDGFTRPPPSNYFTMTDDRGHHYIAQTIHCDPPAPSGSRACELEIPAGYERHPLTLVELHRGGLHGRTLTVSGDEVKSAWSAAEEAHGPSQNEARDGGMLDSSVPRADAGR